MSRQGKLQAPADLVLDGITATDFADVEVGGGRACRVIFKGTGGADGAFMLYGCDFESADPLDWYPLGPALVFAADGSQTFWVNEPNKFIRVSLDAYVAGSFSAKVQRFS